MGSRMCINMYTYIFRKQKKKKRKRHINGMVSERIGNNPPVMHEREEGRR